jgi:AcrR family transcriptional regulator
MTALAATKARVAKKPAKPPRATRGNGERDLKKSEATRQRILDAAALVMSREGFAGTKLSEIAREADVKIATLYYYYASREDLVEAVLVTGARHVREHTEQAVAAMPASSTPLDRLCTAVEAHLRFILEISHYTEAAVRNTSQVPERIRQSSLAEQATYGRLWRRLVDDAAEGTQHRTPAQRKALRMLIIGGLNWSVEWWSPRETSIDELVATALSMTRDSLRPSPSNQRRSR